MSGGRVGSRPSWSPPSPLRLGYGWTPTGFYALSEVVAKVQGDPGLAELAQGRGLDLANALATQPEALADLRQRSLAAIDQPETEL